MQFHLIRLVLLQRHTGDFFDEWGGSLPNRETWLRRVFSRRIDFVHRKIKFSYVPDPEVEGGDPLGKDRATEANQRKRVPR